MNKIKNIIFSLVIIFSFCSCSHQDSNNFISSNSVESSSDSEESNVNRYPLITDEIKEKALAYQNDFEPNNIVIKEQNSYDFNSQELSKMTFTSTREEHYIVYVFEKQFFIGYNGIYDRLFSKIYLWDDGLYCGQINKKIIKGYWYNSSKNALNEQKDCLNMVSNINRYENIVAIKEINGLYDYKANIDVPFDSSEYKYYENVEFQGYLYYPEVAILIDTNGKDKSRVGYKFYAVETTDMIIETTWTVMRVAKNLSYTPIIPNTEVTWETPEGMVDESNNLLKKGYFTITAHWRDLSASAVLMVIEAK